jgi:hypothetical protein
MWCYLTTPHKLQGRGALGKPSPGTIGLSQPPNKPMAAPWQLHAVVRRQRYVGTAYCTVTSNTAREAPETAVM